MALGRVNELCGGSCTLPLDLTYANLQRAIAPFLGGPRTESRAFLAWFLENVYRLEPTQAEDCICDGPDDKGVDGVYVDHSNNRIDIFQAKISTVDHRTIGDTTLKHMVGTLAQFESKAATEALQTSTGNIELRNRLHDDHVADLIGQGWAVRGVLITNISLDGSASGYLKLLENPTLVVYHRDAIRAAYISPDHVAPREGPATFKTFGFPVSEFNVMGAKIVIAPLSATELVKLDSIESGELFDYNVRQSLGRTTVNRDIEKSVRDYDEHRSFMLYHNGVTVIADKVDTSIADEITIRNYLVVNGCQSLTVLWRNRKHVTEDLRVLGRLIELGRDSPLLDKITHNSNNQNGIKPRDFQSNNPIQLRLRSEFQKKYGGEIGYRISRGEEPSAKEIIDNEVAARVLLAFDLGQPWACHQTYRLFDELHSQIFARPDVNANRIVSRIDAFTSVSEELDGLENELVRKYTLTKFFLLYLLSEALSTDQVGSQFIANPSELLGDPIEPNKRACLRKALRQTLKDLLIDLNYEIREREEKEYFDHKRVLKSPTEIRTLRKGVLPSYEKLVGRGRISSFGETWANLVNVSEE